MKRAKTFVFNRPLFLKSQIKFEYTIDNEKYYFYTKLDRPIGLNDEHRYLIAANIWLSYMIDLMIVTLPEEIDIRAIKLEESAMNFWKKIYFNGLLERLYDENLPLELSKSKRLNNSSISIKPFKMRADRKKYLLSMSGGKESLTIMNIFNQKWYSAFDLFFLYYKIKKEGLGYYETRVFSTLKKQIASVRFKTNIEDLKPIMKKYKCKDNSVLVIAELICNALLLCDQYKGIIIGNEYSSNFWNVIHHWYEVNHQHDKTINFGEMINEYINQHITRDFIYFSPFFGLYEHKIAAYFPNNNPYLKIWTSCNNTKKGKNFCCNCPKCAFTYILVLQYSNKKFLEKYFKEDLLEKVELYKTIMDISSDKPLDCVGVKEEAWLALYNIYRKKLDSNSAVMTYFIKEIYPSLSQNIETIRVELEKEQTWYKYIPKEFRKIFQFD